MWRNVFKPKYIYWRLAFCLTTATYLTAYIYFMQPYKGSRITYIWTSELAQFMSRSLNFLNYFFFCALTTIILPKYFPKFFLPENMSLLRFIFCILMTSTGIIIFQFFSLNYFFHSGTDLPFFLTFFFRVLTTSLLFMHTPFIFLFLYVFTYFTETKNEKDKNINDLFYANSTQSTHNQAAESDLVPPQYNDNFERENPVILEFTDNSNKKKFQLPLNRLYYVTSAENYIEIFYQNSEAILTRLVLRNSLKTIEAELIIEANLPLIRCQKAFIVNREKIVAMRGTSKNAYFVLADIELKIPVSRQKFAELESQFSDKLGLL